MYSQTLKKIVSVETIRENTVSTPGGTLRGPSLHWPKMSKQIPMHCLWSMRGVGVVFKSFHQNLLTWWKIYRLLRLLLRSKILHRNWHCNRNGIFNLTEFFQGHNFFKDRLDFLIQKQRFSPSILFTWSKYTSPKWPWSTHQAVPCISDVEIACWGHVWSCIFTSGK